MDGIKVERGERNGRKELDQGSEEGGGECRDGWEFGKNDYTRGSSVLL